MKVLFSEFSINDKYPLLRDTLKRPDFGRMWASELVKQSRADEIYGVDNGAFTAFQKGLSFPEAAFLRRIDSALKVPDFCIVAVCPDIAIAGDSAFDTGVGKRSLDFSLSWIDRLPVELPWFLVIQDGMTREMIAPHLDKFKGLFLGGTDRLKRIAPVWFEFAKEEGKMFHFGRASSVKRARRALLLGCDSCDSSMPVRYATHGEPHNAIKWINAAIGNESRHPTLF